MDLFPEEEEPFFITENQETPTATAPPEVTDLPAPIATSVPSPQKLDLTTIDRSAWDQLLARGLISSQDVLDAQAALRDASNEEEWDGPPKTGKTFGDLLVSFGLPDSFGTMLEDMNEAFVGLLGDLSGSSGNNQKSLGRALTDNNRLRGLGGILVLIGLVGLLIDALGGSGGGGGGGGGDE